MKKTVIFDFDGTIADTFQVALGVYNQIAPSFRCRPAKKDDYLKLRGRRPQEFMKDYGISYLKLPFLLLKIRKELSKKISAIQPMPGVVEAIKEIKAAGFNLGIITSNSRKNVDIFLAANGLSDSFDFIQTGLSFFGKDKIIRQLLKRKNIPPNTAIYVGDETRDIEAAEKAGIPIISVSWGYSPKEILLAFNPPILLDDPRQLLEYLRRSQNRP